MPKMGDAMEAGTLSSWLKHEGDQVEVGDVLAEIETDKATMELEAEDAGVLGGELHRRLVGLDFGQDISDLHHVALAFQPRAEGSRLHRIAHLGHDHLGHGHPSFR